MKKHTTRQSMREQAWGGGRHCVAATFHQITADDVDLLPGELHLVLLIQDTIQEGGRSDMAEARTAFHHAVDQRGIEIGHLLSKASRLSPPVAPEPPGNMLNQWDR